MMEKILLMQRVNKEVVATPSTGAGTHGKGSTPSAQADRSDLNSTSIKPAVLLLLFFIIFLTFKTKKLWDSNGNKMKQNFEFVGDQRVVSRKRAVLTVDLMGLPRWGARSPVSDRATCAHLVLPGERGLGHLSCGGVQTTLYIFNLEQTDSKQPCIVTMRRSCSVQESGLCLSILKR